MMLTIAPSDVLSPLTLEHVPKYTPASASVTGEIFRVPLKELELESECPIDVSSN